jgi:hypothetical protein
LLQTLVGSDAQHFVAGSEVLFGQIADVLVRKLLGLSSFSEYDLIGSGDDDILAMRSFPVRKPWSSLLP